jgi:adenosylcobyric acid synthase
MVQGSASGVGKSAIAAGLCRILRRRGLRVAPFKAQNMSLNAAVTLDGGEIGRSTAVQAAAAGLEPTVDMNPILLKPEAGLRSQVILRGKVWGTLGARDYAAGAVDFWPVVAAALDHLRARFDVVVAEGAGSPAEMNLRERDLANMRVALHAGAAVVLIGDVERGGVFAQLVGTLDLLPPAERALVQGLIVNRFHGDPSLFAAGVTFLERRTERPVFGIVPFVPDLDLAEEDSATLDRLPPSAVGGSGRPGGAPGRSGAELSIAVLRLPHLGNFDDFGPLARLPGVALAYVDRPEHLAGADLIILPGSKSTLADLQFIRERGLADGVVAAHDRGTPVLGICGGFQMLGVEIRDPDHVDSPLAWAPGLALLPLVTVFARAKETCRVRARVVANRGPLAAILREEIEGYEIHNGRTHLADARRVTEPIRVVLRSGSVVDEPDGALSDDGTVLGTYLHGLFANDQVCAAVVGWLLSRKGVSSLSSGLDLPKQGGRPHPSIPHPEGKGTGDSPGSGQYGIVPSTVTSLVQRADPYDRWADALEAALDLPRLFDRCGIGMPAGADR